MIDKLSKFDHNTNVVKEIKLNIQNIEALRKDDLIIYYRLKYVLIGFTKRFLEAIQVFSS